MAVLEVKNLVKSFGGIKAVNNCLFGVEEGSITALIGPNGAGKTTVFNLISGLDRPDSGEIIYRGRDIHILPPHRISNLGIARTFQLIKLFPALSALDNLVLAQPLLGDRLFNVFFRPKKSKEDEKHHLERAREFLKLVGLENKEKDMAGELSYGQQRLLEIARALAQEADLILLDEPAAGVNPKTEATVADALRKLRDLGKTIFLVEHDMPFVMGLADIIIVMAGGTVIAEGKPEEIKNNPKVIEAYLGSSAE